MLSKTRALFCQRSTSMRPRWLYAALFVVLASQGRFISLVLLDSLKFSDSQVGIILGLGVISSMISTPFWSRRSDGPLGCLKVEAQLVSLHFVSFSFLGVAGLIGDNADARFAIALVARFFAAGFISPTGSILDAYTLRTIEDQQFYGRERLWGAVSWALASIAMGLAMDATNSPLGVSLSLLVIGSFLFGLLLLKAPDERPVAAAPVQDEETVARKAPSVHSRPLWRIWSRQPQTIVFFYVTLVMGAATSIVENLLFLYMRQDLNASYTLCGVSVLITVMFEIPLFFMGKSLLVSVGTLRLLLIGMACYVTRVICYTLIETPWTVLMVEPLHGLTFATIQTASVAYVHSRCPKDRIAEGQGMYSLVRSMGSFLGTTIGSRVLESFGSAAMYRTSAIIVTLSALVLIVAFKKYEGVGVDDEDEQDGGMGIGGDFARLAGASQTDLDPLEQHRGEVELKPTVKNTSTFEDGLLQRSDDGDDDHPLAIEVNHS